MRGERVSTVVNRVGGDAAHDAWPLVLGLLVVVGLLCLAAVGLVTVWRHAAAWWRDRRNGSLPKRVPQHPLAQLVGSDPFDVNRAVENVIAGADQACRDAAKGGLR